MRGDYHSECVVITTVKRDDLRSKYVMIYLEKVMKRFISVFLAAIMAAACLLSFSGCQEGKTDETAAAERIITSHRTEMTKPAMARRPLLLPRWIERAKLYAI